MTLLQDLQYGWRSLTRTPVFFLVAVLSVMLGIGANTAIFSLLDSCLLKALPIKNPEQLVILSDPASSGLQVGQSSGERDLISYPEFQEFKRMKSLRGVFATESSLNRVDAIIDGAQEQVQPRMVSGDFFSTLGVQPQLGYFFNAAVDDGLGQTPYAVLSDGFWARRFGRSPDVLGKTIVVHQASLTVIGVAPRGFFGETVGSTPDFWLPIGMQLQLVPGRDWVHVQPNPLVKVQWLHVFGRLQPGYTLAQAQTEANVILKRNLEQSYASLSGDVKKQYMDQRIRARLAAGGASELRSQVQEPLLVVFAAVGAVLLICCVNVANLLLARANNRRREVMIRLALGANKFRILRQLMTESLIISVLGACGGLLFAQSGAELLMRMASDPSDPVQINISLDWRVLAFTLGVALLTTLLFGLAPAFRAAGTGIGTALREGAGGMSQSAGRLFLSKAFVVAQVALSLALVVGAGLFLRTLVNLKNMDLGYPRERLLTMRVDGAAAGYKDKQLIALYNRLRESLANAPGVNQVTYSENGLLSTTDSADNVEAEGYPKVGKDAESTRWDEVAPGYFTTVRIPILLGREISERDRPGTPLACVINQTFAKQFFSGRNPIGRHITTVYADTRTTFEVVGVAKDSRDHALRGKLRPRFFSALQQAAPEVPESVYFEVRTNADAGAELISLRRVIRNVDPNVAILSAHSVDDLLENRVRNDRLVARLTSVFGAIALLLAAIGIYGVLAYAVSQRTTEIGIRMAVGAQAGTVVRMVLQENGLMLLAGLAIGLLLSLGVTRLIGSRLVGVEAVDPAVFLSSIAIILALGTLAGYGAAARAARIDPIRALRNE